jgi:predicted secreted Zn-dependent protease
MLKKSLMSFTFYLALVLFSTKIFAQTNTSTTTNLGYITYTTEVIYYEVNASTANQLDEQLRFRGPFDEEAGVPFASETDYRVNIQGVCNKDGSITGTGQATVKYTYPKWKPPKNATPELIKQWDTYIKNLETHEKGHEEIGAYIAKQMIEEVLKIQVSDCNIIDKKIKEIEEKYQKKIEDEFKMYDLETNHGVNQGAEWPPPKVTPVKNPPKAPPKIPQKPPLRMPPPL